jgi:hypothetical protein
MQSIATNTKSTPWRTKFGLLSSILRRHTTLIFSSYHTDLMNRLQALMRDLTKQKKISTEAFQRFFTDFGNLEGRETIYRVREARCVFDTLQPREKTRIRTESKDREGGEALLTPKNKERTTSDGALPNLDATSSNGTTPEFLSIVVSYSGYPFYSG